MKNIKLLLFLIMSIFITFISFLNFSTLNERTLNKHSISYTISKPTDTSNSEFVQILIELAKKNNINIVYQENSFIDNKLHTTFYTTNNNSQISNFLNINSNILNESSVSNFGEKSRNLKSFNLFSNTTIKNFKSIEKFDLSNTKYKFISTKNNLENFIYDLKSQSFKYIKDESKEFYESNIYLDVQLYIYFLIFICFIVSIFSRKKQDTIMLTLGYSTFNIFIYNLIEIFKILALNFSFTLIIASIISLLFNINALFYFLSYLFEYYIIHIVIIVIITLISNLLIFKINPSQIIRGYKIHNSILISAISIKLIILTLISFSLALTFENYKVINNNFISQKIANEKIDSYATLPINLKEYTATPELFELVDKESLNVYNNTTNTLNGILIDTSNYRVINNEKSLCETLKQCYIYANYNYIKDNNISNNESLYSDEKVKLLIPSNNKNIDSMIEFMKLNYKDFSDNDVYSYDENINIFTYNEFSKDNGGFLKSVPIIVLPNKVSLDSEYFFNIASSVSGGYYFVKVDKSDPYTSVIPYLNDNSIKYFKSASLISSNFQKNIDSLQIKLLTNIFYIILNLILLLLTLFTISKIYIFKNEKLYAIKSLHGYNIYLIIRNLYIVNIVLYMVLLLLSRNPLITITLFSIDTIINIIFSKILLQKNLNKIIRGDN